MVHLRSCAIEKLAIVITYHLMFKRNLKKEPDKCRKTFDDNFANSVATDVTYFRFGRRMFTLTF